MNTNTREYPSGDVAILDRKTFAKVAVVDRRYAALLPVIIAAIEAEKGND